MEINKKILIARYLVKVVVIMLKKKSLKIKTKSKKIIGRS